MGWKRRGEYSEVSCYRRVMLEIARCSFFKIEHGIFFMTVDSFLRSACGLKAGAASSSSGLLMNQVGYLE